MVRHSDDRIRLSHCTPTDDNREPLYRRLIKREANWETGKVSGTVWHSLESRSLPSGKIGRAALWPYQLRDIHRIEGRRTDIWLI